MPSRARREVAPENPWARAAWLDSHLDSLLERIPLSEAGWASVHDLEKKLFPRPSPVSEFLGGPLDPTCPACGIETEDGTVERQGDLFRVTYASCGHVFEVTEPELRSRVRHADRSP